MNQQALIFKEKKVAFKKPKRKGEEKVQLQVCAYLRKEYPNVIFTCDLSSGMKLPIHIAAKNKKMRSSRGLPDLFIAQVKTVKYEGDKYISGLFLELKNENVVIYNKDGSMRKDEHLYEQNSILEQLRGEGYMAEFAIGFKNAKNIIDNYLQ